MFIAFIIEKKWKQSKYVSADKYMSKCVIYMNKCDAMKYHLVMKRNEGLIQAV